MNRARTAILSLMMAGMSACAAQPTAVRDDTSAVGTPAVRAADFLNSLGMDSAIAGRGETLPRTIACTKYLGVRWFRVDLGPSMPLIELHNQTGVRFSCMTYIQNDTAIARLIQTGKELAAAGALLAIEGPNEPNNFGGVTWEGVKGGAGLSWLPVAKAQHALYVAVKSDPELSRYPVFSICENGAEMDNVGLQFLTIPPGAGTLMPDGTQYADYANCHNYLGHQNWPGWHDNQSWICADPTPACRVDGLYGNYGKTWRKHFQGYSEAELLTLPRVTTETGRTIVEGETNEDQQARLFIDFYLAQFKRGWSYTSFYLLRDRTDESGNQRFGFYRPDYTPRKAAICLHNLTTILADSGSIPTPGKLNYSIANPPATVHDLLLQKSDGTFELVVWSERFASGGTDNVTVDLGGKCATIHVYDPTVGTEATQTLSGVSSLPLALTDHPVIIEIGPGK